MNNVHLTSVNPSPWEPQSGRTINYDTQSALRANLSRLVRGESLRQSEAESFLDALLDTSATDAQIGAALVALTIKGPNAPELAGLAAAMRSRAVRIQPEHDRFIDTAGTGSSSAKSFNVSTGAAFVIAGAGLPVAKHGARAATSLSGSADVLTALGVQISTAPAVAERCLNEIGICFMFAPLYHQATARVAAIRRELGIQTIFNLIGPLTNPASAPHQIIGVWHPSLVEPLANALARLGTRKSWVVHGLDGLDEITLANTTIIAEVSPDNVRTFQIAPEDFGLTRMPLNALRCDRPESSAHTIREVLSGKLRNGARDLVVMNAAAALLIGGKAESLIEGRRQAERSIDEGAAHTKLDQLIRLTNQ